MSKGYLVLRCTKKLWIRMRRACYTELSVSSSLSDDLLAAEIRRATGLTAPSSPDLIKRYYKILRTNRRHEHRSQYKNVVPINATPIPKIGKAHPDYVKDPDFYKSQEWRQLRYLALKNTDGRCGCCGASQKDGVVLHVDHIQPRYKRPDLSLSLDNLQVLCEDCNVGKGAWDDTDWRIKL